MQGGKHCVGAVKERGALSTRVSSWPTSGSVVGWPKVAMSQPRVKDEQAFFRGIRRKSDIAAIE